MIIDRCVYVIASGAPPVAQLADLVGLLQKRGWTVGVILTPTAAGWIDAQELATSTGCVVRSAPRLPSEDDPLPKADAVLAAPLTFNSVNKWAAGFADTVAVGVLCELLGAGVPIVAAPCVKELLRRHPAYESSIKRLSEAGVRFVDPDAVTYPGENGLAEFDWPAVIRLFESATEEDP